MGIKNYLNYELFYLTILDRILRKFIILKSLFFYSNNDFDKLGVNKN